MSSRIVSGDAAKAAQQVFWRRAGESPSRPLTSDPRCGDGQEGGGGNDSQGLKAQLNRLQAESLSRENAARTAGLEEGRQSALQQLEAPLKEAFGRLCGHMEELAGFRSRFRREAEEDLVKLAIAISRRVLRRELTADPEAILGIVKAMLDKVDARELLRIRVHPADVALVRGALDSRDTPDKLEVVADGGLERGGLLVETTRGVMDASVETQLLEIERGFTDRLRR